ncbi:hypothetical protein D9M68_715780 [compost metagenome]
MTEDDVWQRPQWFDSIANEASDKDFLVQQDRQVTDRLADDGRSRSNAGFGHVVLDVQRLLHCRDRFALLGKQPVAKCQKNYSRGGKPYTDGGEIEHVERAACQFLAHPGDDDVRRCADEGCEPAKQGTERHRHEKR